MEIINMALISFIVGFVANKKYHKSRNRISSIGSKVISGCIFSIFCTVLLTLFYI